MHLVTLGLNHATAPLKLRERVAVSPEQLAPTLHALTHRFAQVMPHAVVLSTCNRTEVYAAANVEHAGLEAFRDALGEWIATRHGIPAAALASHWYWLVDADSVRHAFRVASGLDSMVLGEPQILGQMKEAAREAHAVGTLGTPLRQAFDRSFAVAKTVRSTTAIGAASVSMAAAAVRLSKRLFSDLSEQRVLMIGAGEMIELAATHFAAQKPAKMAIANRTTERAEKLAAKLAADGVATRTMQLSELPGELANYDVVVACTGSTLPLVGLGMVERAIKARRRRPMFMVDMGVPRDIEAEVGKLDDVYLYSVDELGQVVASGQQQRLEAAGEAEAIVDREVGQFVRWLEHRETVPVIREIHQRGETFRSVELERARRRLARGDEPAAVLESLAAGITAKFLHGPTQLLHDAPDDLRAHLIEYLPRLFGADARK